MSSLVTNLNSSTAQEIINWVTTADGCVHTAYTTQLDLPVGKFVHTRRNCRQPVANFVHTATRLNWTFASRRVCVGGVYWALWLDDITQWTRISLVEAVRLAEDRDRYRQFVHTVAYARTPGTVI